MKKFEFYNRKNELLKVKRALSSKGFEFIVIYGRRRCGKTRLLQEILRKQDIYFVADQKETPLQLQDFAGILDRYFENFALVQYPNWDALFKSLQLRITKKTTIVIDEFPYLVQNSPELPSLLQKIMDSPINKINFVICGSSQRMMSSTILEASSPLYGRATHILNIRPMKIQTMAEALDVHGEKAIEAFAVWGGVPRYWELASDFSTLQKAIQSLLLDENGTLNQEPQRLLMDEVRTAVQPHSILTLVAQGEHTLTGVSQRLNKPTSNLTRPLAQLVEMGYLRREVAFGENIKNSKKTMYQVDDPFILFWYRFIPKFQSFISLGQGAMVMQEIKKMFPLHVSIIWEQLARESIHELKPLKPYTFRPAQRWWGKGRDGNSIELDLVTESLDGQTLFVAEVKWQNKTNCQKEFHLLREKVERLPFSTKKYKKILWGMWIKNSTDYSPKSDECIFLPEDIIH